MTTIHVRLLWLGVGLALGVGAWMALLVMRVGDAVEWRIPAAAGVIAAPRGLGDLVQAVVGNDPFRFDRTPSSVPFGQIAVVAAPVGRAAPVAPVVTGIVGPPWRAALEGLSGRQDGLLVAAGDTIAGLRILAVGRDTVVITAPDITWRLPVRRP